MELYEMFEGPAPAGLSRTGDLLADAVNAERAARAALRDAVGRQSAIMCRLRDAGVRLTDAVVLATRALGEAATPAVRRLLAVRLRKRAEREDRRPRDLLGGIARDDSALLPVVERKEATMAEKRTLFRRTITEEEYVAPNDIEDEEQDVEAAEDESPRRKGR
jgi:hypothetical protein